MNDQLVGDEAACDHVAIRVLGLDDGNNFDRKYCLWIDATIAEFAPLIAICLGDATTCGLCARDPSSMAPTRCLPNYAQQRFPSD